MKKVLGFLVGALLSNALAQDSMIEVESTKSVDACVDGIVKIIESKKALGLFTVIDHKKNAIQVGLNLPDTKVIVFGNPRAGTLLMQADSAIAYELPLKILVRETKDKKVMVSYRDPSYYPKNFSLENSKIPGKMSGLLHKLAASCSK